MRHSVGFSKEAASDIDAVYRSDRRLFQRILNKVESLGERPKEGKPLVGNHKGEYSLRLGSYRIVYELDHEARAVYVLTIKHRKHVY